MLALCVLGSDSAGAAPVGREKAAAAAEAFWNSVPETKSSCAVLKFVDDSRAAAAGIPAYYIFENVAGSGFVIISGNDNLPPVLGYSFESSLGEGDFPPNFREWLDYMSLAANSPSALSVSGWTAPHAGSPVVDLQTARWNQTAPYVTGDVLEIDTAGLEAGTYTLVLSRQDDVKEISLTF